MIAYYICLTKTSAGMVLYAAFRYCALTLILGGFFIVHWWFVTWQLVGKRGGKAVVKDKNQIQHQVSWVWQHCKHI